MQRLQTADREELVRFLRRDYANNLYFFSYLDSLADPGRDSAIYGHRERGELVLAGLISPAHACVAADRPDLIAAFAALLPTAPGPLYILGRRGPTLELVRHYERGYIPRDYIFACLDPERMPSPRALPVTADRAALTDVPDLVTFYRPSRMMPFAERRLPGIIQTGTAYLIRRGGEIAACAVTTTETEDLAMIGSVYTAPPYRRRGLATACVLTLSRDLTARGKGACLFYEAHDPGVTVLYARIGFRPAGEGWILAKPPGE